jgi:hypothetical protein
MEKEPLQFQSRSFHPIWISVLLIIAPQAFGDRVATVEEEPPLEVADSIRETLQTTAIEIQKEGAPIYKFWFREEIPIGSQSGSSPDASLRALREGTLLGVVSVLQSQRDYRDDTISKGVYTLRYALQPQDGNHLGTAHYPYFAVLVPANSDDKLDGLTTYSAVVKASSRHTATGHPVNISLRPPGETPTNSPELTEPAPHHKAVRLQLPARVNDSNEAAHLEFELVYQGTGEH